MGDDYHRFSLYLKLQYHSDETIVSSLEGVYAGRGYEVQLPMAGRIYLERIFTPNDKQSFDIYEETKYSKIKIVDIVNGTKEASLLNRFKGNNDDYIESPAFFDRLSQKKGLNIQKSINNNLSLDIFERNYYSFCLSSSRKHILRYPIRINANGKVELKGIHNNTYIGKAERFKQFLSIFIYLKNEGSNNRAELEATTYHFHILFTITDHTPFTAPHFYGTFSKPNLNGNLEAGREILYPLPQEREWESMSFQEIPLPLLGEEVFNEYKTLEVQYPGLSSFLTGEENNLIISQMMPGRKFERQENYGELFFTSALYFASKDQDKAKKHLDKALLHGFNDRNELRKQLEEGSFRECYWTKGIDLEKLFKE